MRIALTKGTTLQKGKYTIVKTLGQGSFGITYLATTRLTMMGNLGQMEMKAKVAIKEFFLKEMNSRSEDGSSIEGSGGSLFTNYRQKFKKEAENLSKMDHPNIVKVSDIFDENNTTYYVMQYIDGQSLDDYISQQGRIEETEAVSILMDIGKAVQYMHSRKMLHLDLKPRNVMMDNEGKIYLIDFGLSKQYDSMGEPESSTNVGAGTPGYAPVEQLNYQGGEGFPVTMDVYALGATMFKMLTGVRAPVASDILNDGFPLNELQECRITDLTTASVAKAMSPGKKDRYQTVEDFLNAIDEKPTIITDSSCITIRNLIDDSSLVEEKQKKHLAFEERYEELKSGRRLPALAIRNNDLGIVSIIKKHDNYFYSYNDNGKLCIQYAEDLFNLRNQLDNLRWKNDSRKNCYLIVPNDAGFRDIMEIRNELEVCGFPVKRYFFETDAIASQYIMEHHPDDEIFLILSLAEKGIGIGLYDFAYEVNETLYYGFVPNDSNIFEELQKKWLYDQLNENENSKVIIASNNLNASWLFSIVQSVFGKQAIDIDNSQNSYAFSGANYYAGIFLRNEILFLQYIIVPWQLSLIVSGEEIKEIIPKDSTIPCKGTISIAKCNENQKTLAIFIAISDPHSKNENGQNDIVGAFLVENLPRTMNDQIVAECTIDIDANRCIQLSLSSNDGSQRVVHTISSIVENKSLLKKYMQPEYLPILYENNESDENTCEIDT